MKQLFNGLQVALAAVLLVSLPSLVFWSVGAFDLQPSPEYNPRVVPRQAHAGSAAQRHVPAWRPQTDSSPLGRPDVNHRGGNLTIR